MSWYTQFRPRQISELHLESVRSQLLGYMQAGSFPKVFLFAGPKGTGKTSASRILGALFNDPANVDAVEHDFFGSTSKTKQIPYVEPDKNSKQNQLIFTGQSYIVTELDAASNRGIDDVRTLKERVTLPPQDGKVSVYILDEAHMLTTEAFNALLKLLEEPPAHVVFILATTELHKIPATILSRTTIVPFQKASISELVTSLSSILKQVKLAAKDTVLEEIAARAGGSFRDAVKYLEQVATQTQASGKKELEKEDVAHYLHGYAREDQLVDLIRAVINKDATAVVEHIGEFRSQAIDPAVLYSQLLSLLHLSLLRALGVKDGPTIFTKQISLFFLNELQSISHHQEVLPFLHLELALLSIIDRAVAKSGDSTGGTGSQTNKGAGGSISSSTSSSKKPASNRAAEVVPPSSSVGLRPASLSNQSSSEFIQAPTIVKSDSIQNLDHVDSKEVLSQWNQFVQLVEHENATIAALLRTAKPLPEKSNGIARVQVYYPFHRDQLMQPKFLQLFQECARSMTGHEHRFEFELGTLQSESSESAVTDTNSANDTVTLAGELLM